MSLIDVLPTDLISPAFPLPCPYIAGDVQKIHMWYLIQKILCTNHKILCSRLKDQNSFQPYQEMLEVQLWECSSLSMYSVSRLWVYFTKCCSFCTKCEQCCYWDTECFSNLNVLVQPTTTWFPLQLLEFLLRTMLAEGFYFQKSIHQEATQTEKGCSKFMNPDNQ